MDSFANFRDFSPLLFSRIFFPQNFRGKDIAKLTLFYVDMPQQSPLFCSAACGQYPLHSSDINQRPAYKTIAIFGTL